MGLKNVKEYLLYVAAFGGFAMLVHRALTILDRRRSDKLNEEYNNAKPAITGGVWTNKNNEIFNCFGDKVGRLEYEWKSFEDIKKSASK